MAAGDQKIFPFHGLRQQKRLSSMVPGMGCDHFSRKSFASEHHRHPDRSDWSLDGAEI